MSIEDLNELWLKCKNALKDRDFLKQLKDFDIRRVTEASTAQIAELFANDPWMRAGLITRESKFCMNLFQWVNTIIEYIGVANKLRALGMKAIEEKRNASLKLVQINEKCLKSKKMFKRLKSL